MSKVKKPARLSLDTDWGAIRALYAAGATIKELSQSTGIKPFTIYQRRHREKWDLDKQGIMQKGVALNQDAKSVQKRIRKISPLSNGVETVLNAYSLHKQKFLNAGADVATTGMMHLSDMIQEVKNDIQLTQIEKLATISKIAGEFMKTATPVFGLKDNAAVTVGVQLQILSEVPETSVLDQL